MRDVGPYREAPPKPPTPKKSFWCRIGLHRWRGVKEPMSERLYDCTRPGCEVSVWEYAGWRGRPRRVDAAKRT